MIKSLTLVLVFLQVYSWPTVHNMFGAMPWNKEVTNSDDPLFQNLAKELNYPLEEHIMTTEDGYVLTFFRI